MQLSELEIIRREKLGQLRALGINPYPADLYPVNHTSKAIKEQYTEGKKVIIAGKIDAKKKYKEKPLLLKFKTAKEEYKCTLTGTKFALVKIK